MDRSAIERVRSKFEAMSCAPSFDSFAPAAAFPPATSGALPELTTDPSLSSERVAQAASRGRAGSRHVPSVAAVIDSYNFSFIRRSRDLQLSDWATRR